jgi:hypothetical protein
LHDDQLQEPQQHEKKPTPNYPTSAKQTPLHTLSPSWYANNLFRAWSRQPEPLRGEFRQPRWGSQRTPLRLKGLSLPFEGRNQLSSVRQGITDRDYLEPNPDLRECQSQADDRKRDILPPAR